VKVHAIALQVDQEGEALRQHRLDAPIRPGSHAAGSGNSACAINDEVTSPEVEGVRRLVGRFRLRLLALRNRGGHLAGGKERIRCLTSLAHPNLSHNATVCSSIARKAMAYDVEVERDAQAALDVLPARDRARLSTAMLTQLSHQPAIETRNRKRMQPGGPADWELRVQPYRVYYDVDEAQQVVSVVAIARKERETPRPIG
jgi:mRNA-degrading endonuclease RelE of RelBE toxin-antitoxin system